MEIVALLARAVVAVLVLLWATAVVPQLAAIAVAAAVGVFAIPFALATWSGAAVDLHLVGVELARGAALGLTAAAPLWAAATAGRWAGARWRTGVAPSPISTLYLAMMGVAFLAVDGPVLVCAAIANSYAAAPVGSPLLDGGVHAAMVIGWLATAVRLALPVALAVAVAELSAAAAVRAAAAVAVAWPSSALAPTVTLLVAAPMVPLLVAALAEAVRAGLAS